MFDFGDFKITVREILSSVVIIAVMLLFGVLVAGKISDWQDDQNAKYNKALKITEENIFEYGMRTNVGNAFVYGELKAVDTVTYPEIGKEYMYVKKVKEEYTRHTRQVSHTTSVNGKSHTYYTTEVYWSWDYVSSDDKQCKEISFLGVTFESNKINLPAVHYIDTMKESSYIRYKYYGTATQFKGTIFTQLKDGTILDKTPFYNDKTIDQELKDLESSCAIIIFWFAWVVLIGVCVFGFYYIDNRWLE